MNKSARNKRWREMYDKRGPDGKRVHTYRSIARKYDVDPNTVWNALHPEVAAARYRKRKNSQPPQPRKPPHLRSVRLALDEAEWRELDRRAAETRKPRSRLVRAILCGLAEPLALPDVVASEEER